MKKNRTMSQSEPGGNTETPGKHTPKHAGTQCYRWQFTLKAHSDEPGEPIKITALTIYENLKPFCKEFYYQLEVGKDGYKHYQGCFSLLTKHRLQEVKNIIGWNDVHLENAKNWHALKNYSTKTDTRIGGPWSHESNWIRTINIDNFYPWQKEVHSLITRDQYDDRKIWWFWEDKGNAGKTAFCKWCCVHLKATILRGGALKDIAHSLPDNPKIVICDFPRTCEDRINYDALEQVKDGMVFSAKYESRTKVFNSPVMICFANFLPEKESMSLDRWEIHYLNNDFIIV